MAGQSKGGNAALSHAAAHPDLAGVIALAPAGNPTTLARNPQVQPSIAQAAQMVAAGRGNDRASFTSSNNGTMFSVNTTAAIFLSFTDPQGPAAFPRALPRITVSMPWTAGNADRTQVDADAQFATLPRNARNRMVHVSGPHLGHRTPPSARPWRG